MGYAHGTKWNRELIINGIYEVINYYELDRMPTRSEIESYYHNSRLTNKISKTGGFDSYAEELKLQTKDSESKLGIRFEKYIADELQKQGFKADLTTVRFPYDVLVNSRVKIDVKVGREVENKVGKYYTFNLEKKQQTCDIYIAVCINSEKEVKKVYVIPASVMSGKTQLSIGLNHSKYDCYLNKFWIVKTLDKAMEELEANYGSTKSKEK